MKIGKFYKRLIALLTAAVIIVSTFFVFDAFADDSIVPSVEGNFYTYEAEQGILVKNAYVNQTISGYSGTGSVNILDSGSGVTMNINVPYAGNYKVYVYGSNNDGGNKCDYFSVNGGTNYLVATPGNAKNTWYCSEPGTENWESGVLKPVAVSGGFAFSEGTNTIKITVNWGYAYYDKVVLERLGVDEAVTDVINKIDALPQKVTESVRSVIESVKSAYDALNDSQKLLVTNYGTLENAIEILNTQIQEPAVDGGTYIYETEICSYPNTSCYTDTAISGYSGTGYVFIMEGALRIRLNVPVEGNYRIYVSSANNDGGNKCDYVTVNEDKTYLAATSGTSKNTWSLNAIGTENWENDQLKPLEPVGGIKLNAGVNIIEISANWGYCAYDKIVLEPIVSEKNNQDAINNVINLIKKLPERVTEASRSNIEEAQKAYEALTSGEKAEVTNADVLNARLGVLNAEIQEPQKDGSKLIYEVEICGYQNTSCYTDTAIKGYSGTGYVFIMEGAIRTRLNVPDAGKYNIYIASANNDGGNKCEYVYINDTDKFMIATDSGNKNIWVLNQPGTENWENGQLKPLVPKGGFELKKGINTIEICANWGYCAYDKIVLVPVSSGDVIDEDNVTKLNKLIAELPAVITADDIAGVTAANNLYNSLSGSDKKFIKNPEKLLRVKAMVNALNANKRAYKGTMRYECEDGTMRGNSSVVTEKSVFADFSGQGYVFLFDKSFDVDVYVEKNGYYHINVISGTDSNDDKCDFFVINGGEKYLVATKGQKGVWKTSEPGTEYWANGKLTPQSPAKGYYLKAGKNKITVLANWGYCSYDAIEIYPQGISPKTGDSKSRYDLLLITFAMIISLGGIIITGKKLKA